MASIVEYQGSNLAIGLVWLPLDIDPAKSKKQRKEQLSSTNSLFCAEIKTPFPMLGFAGGRKKKSDLAIKSCFAGALWLTELAQGRDAIIVLPLAEDQLWVCATAQGVPVEGSDFVYSAASIDKANAFIAELHAKFPTATLFSAGGMIYELTSVYGVEVVDVHPLASPSSFSLMKRLGKPAYFNALLSIIGVSLVCGAGFGYYLYEKEVEEQERIQAEIAAAAAKKAAAKLPTAEEQYTASFVTQFNAKRFITAKDFNELVTSLASHLPEQNNGWLPNDLKCSNFGCTARYERQVYSKPFGAIEDATATVNDLDYADVAMNFTHPNAATLPLNLSPDQLLQFFEANRNETLRALQGAKDNGCSALIQLNQPVWPDVATPRPASAVAGAASPSASKIKVASHAWNIQCPAYLKDSFFHFPKNLFATAIDWDLKDAKEAKFAAKGVWFEASGEITSKKLSALTPTTASAMTTQSLAMMQVLPPQQPVTQAASNAAAALLPAKNPASSSSAPKKPAPSASLITTQKPEAKKVTPADELLNSLTPPKGK
ncbi:type 4b pilus protein PilO2 [Iodobacter sp. HSC-16F04]|uniref:Type 4b pilus protein PilO2 n=1 Tax=Iodobacter violaceini TaxID=3044271 RepID=A0ABX0KQA6_9NEIS|nr:type 4b pilus protein PilO2 [Iodobacter violacea]NHQ86756.1 type 4b pilus protein PilO2 [Iodobacter violacea]